MSAETLKYQKELIRDAKMQLGDIQVTENMIETDDFAGLVSIIMMLEEARDIAVATDEDEKIKIMNKWL
jgi:hypothetical protein